MFDNCLTLLSSSASFVPFFISGSGMHLIIIVGIVGRLSADCQHFDMHSNWDGNTLHKLKLSICPLGPLFLDFR